MPVSSSRLVGLGEVFGAGQLLDRDLEGLGGAVAQNLHRHGLAGVGAGHFQLQVAAVGDLLAVELEDEVAALEAGFVRRAFGRHVADQRAGGVLELELLGQGGGDVLDHDAQVTAGDMAVLDEAVHDVAGEVDGDGEADALVAAAAAQNGGVDADEPAVGVHQRAARVARD